MKDMLPSRKSTWRPVAVFLIAAIVGLVLFMSKETELISYASDDPLACVNCHVMTPVYNSWLHSSHREWASCNDCHTPQNNIFNKYYFKLKDGLLHSTVFTLRAEPQVISMRKASKEVVQNNCIRCHSQQIKQTKYDGWISTHGKDRTERKCWSCHREVPHGKVHGISSVRNNIAPLPTDKGKRIVPEWLETELNQNKNK